MDDAADFAGTFAEYDAKGLAALVGVLRAYGASMEHEAARWPEPGREGPGRDR